MDFLWVIKKNVDEKKQNHVGIGIAITNHVNTSAVSFVYSGLAVVLTVLVRDSKYIWLNNSVRRD